MDIKKVSNLAIQQQQINRVDESKNKIGGNSGAVGTNVNQSRGLFDAAVAKTNTINSTDKLNNIRDLQTMAATQTEKTQNLTSTQLKQELAIAKDKIASAKTVLEVKSVINGLTFS